MWAVLTLNDVLGVQIFVPMVRQVDNYQEDIERIRSHQDASTSAGATSKSAKPSNAYIIYQVQSKSTQCEGAALCLLKMPGNF